MRNSQKTCRVIWCIFWYKIPYNIFFDLWTYDDSSMVCCSTVRCLTIAALGAAAGLCSFENIPFSDACKDVHRVVWYLCLMLTEDLTPHRQTHFTQWHRKKRRFVESAIQILVVFHYAGWLLNYTTQALYHKHNTGFEIVFPLSDAALCVHALYIRIQLFSQIHKTLSG